MYLLRYPGAFVKDTALLYNYNIDIVLEGGGRPRHMWQRTAHNEALEKGKSWSEVKRMAANRARWWCFVDALCPLNNW
jgi:hypothetical protein